MPCLLCLSFPSSQFDGTIEGFVEIGLAKSDKHFLDVQRGLWRSCQNTAQVKGHGARS